MRNDKFIAILVLAVLLALLVNFLPSNSDLSGIKSILGLSFLFFFPGYSFVKLLFKKDLSDLEILIFSIGLSISLVILASMAVYLAGLEITVANIFNILLVATIIMILANIFKGASESKTGIKLKDKIFYLNLILLFAVLAVMVCLSVYLPSKDQFVELYWAVSKIENLRNVTQVSCETRGCGLSGIYMIGDVNLNGENFNILVTDLDKSGKYDSFCLDINHDGKYCGGEEGPYRYYETFFIGPIAFSSLEFGSSQIAFVNYPKYSFDWNFTVSFVAKSHYSDSKYFSVRVTANGTAQYSEDFPLDPNQEIARNVSIYLPTKGLYRVEVNARPRSGQDSGATIDFWIERKI